MSEPFCKGAIFNYNNVMFSSTTAIDYWLNIEYFIVSDFGIGHMESFGNGYVEFELNHTDYYFLYKLLSTFLYVDLIISKKSELYFPCETVVKGTFFQDINLKIGNLCQPMRLKILIDMVLKLFIFKCSGNSKKQPL